MRREEHESLSPAGFKGGQGRSAAEVEAQSWTSLLGCLCFAGLIVLFLLIHLAAR